MKTDQPKKNKLGIVVSDETWEALQIASAKSRIPKSTLAGLLVDVVAKEAGETGKTMDHYLSD